jgi:hypothetical protein
LKAYPINKSQKTLAKSLLNNLLGRFGISLHKPITEVVSEKRFSVMETMHKIMDYKIIGKDKYMVSYINKLHYPTITDHKLDIVKVMKKYKDYESQPLNITSVPISSAVTAYGRIHISRIKLDIINKLGGNIYYSDTDSIVTDTKLPDNMIHSTEIGKLKLEHFIKSGIFISGKLYAFINDKDEVIIKSKGVDSKSFNYEHFVKLLQNKNVEQIVKYISTIN